MKLVANGPNRLTSGPLAQIMRKSIFTGRIAIFMKLGADGPDIGAQAVPELRSWENQFLRPNGNFHEIGCSRPKSAHKRSPSSDDEKINFYGRIAIFMKLGGHGPNRPTSGPLAQMMRKSIFTAESKFLWNWVLTAQIGWTSSPRAQIMRKSTFTLESQISWNWVLTAQIGAGAVLELRSWQNQFLRPNRNFHEIGCWRPKSAHQLSPSSDNEKINFYDQIAIFVKLGADSPNRRTSCPRGQIIR